MIVVREYQLLFQHIDLIDIAHIDDESLADTHKPFGLVAYLVCKGAFHLAKVHTDSSTQLINHNNIGIVTIGFEVDNLGDVYSQQFVSRVEEYQVCLYIYMIVLAFRL